jgi:hypothetical protein
MLFSPNIFLTKLMTESQELIIAPASATSEDHAARCLNVHEERKERSGEFAVIGPISVSFKVFTT